MNAVATMSVRMNRMDPRYLLAILVLLASAAYGDTTVGQLEPTSGTWRVYRGSTYVCTANSEAAAFACAAADAESRRTTTRYQIRYPNRYVTVTYRAPSPPVHCWRASQPLRRSEPGRSR